MITTALAISILLAAPPADDPLEPLRFLAGSCWQGRFPDGRNADTHCFEGFYGNAFLRDTHLVWGESDDYRGETIYHRDGANGAIVYRYWNSVGGVSDGAVVVEPGRLLFPGERYTSEDGSTIEMRSFMQPLDAGRYLARSERKVEAGWEPLWEMEFRRVGPADRDPAAARVPQLDRAARDRCTALVDHDFAFTASVSGNSELYLYDGGGVRRLTDHPAPDHTVAWAGRDTVLFQTLRDGNREVYSATLSPWTPRNLTNDPEQDLLPQTLPDGRIVFFSSRDRGWDRRGALGGHLFVTDRSGAQVERLPAAGFGSTTGVHASPDGKKLLYTRYGEKRGIHELDLATGRERPLIEGAVGGARYSPDGRSIAFYREREEGTELIVADRFGKSERKLNREPGYYFDLSWAPDGSALLVTASRDGKQYDIRCVGADGSYDVPVIDDPTDARTPAWRPR